MVPANLTSWLMQPLNSMAKSVVANFSRDCMKQYAHSKGIDWDVSLPSADAILMENVYDPAINDGILSYINKNGDILSDYFEYLTCRVETQLEFEYFVLIEIADSEFKDGYNHAAFLRFIAWAMYLAFEFYKHGKVAESTNMDTFPEAAMHVIMDILDHYLELQEFYDEDCFTGMIFESAKFMLEKNGFCWHDIRIR